MAGAPEGWGNIFGARGLLQGGLHVEAVTLSPPRVAVFTAAGHGEVHAVRVLDGANGERGMSVPLDCPSEPNFLSSPLWSPADMYSPIVPPVWPLPDHCLHFLI